ncbi:MAG: dockerin type I domain-containing protein, partial [Candidatus Omnitrophota bacterium]
LVDTQATVPANSQTTISLVNGTGNSGVSNLAVDNGSYLSVDTGTAQFRIKKSNFNMIDKTVVNGKELVQQNNSGGLSMVGYEDTTFTFNGMTQTLVKNTVYDSKNDPDSTAVIEENGPVRTVIKAMGSFKDTSGNRFMDYTVRLHFYKGKSYVKSQVIMRHGQEEKHPNQFGGYSQQPRTFSNMQVSIPLNLGQTKKFEFSTNNGIISGIINKAAYMFQAFSQSHRSSVVEADLPDGSGAWPNPPMERVDIQIKDTNYIQKGLEIKNGNMVLNQLGNENNWTNSYAEIKDQNNNGLTVAMQYMSSYWPTSIEFGTDGSVEIGVFSKFNSKKDITMGWGTHETREIILDFHTSPVNNIEDIYRLEQPIIGRNHIDYYGNTKVFFDSDGIVTADEFYQFFIDNYGRVDFEHPKNAWLQDNSGVFVWRVFWYNSCQGGDYALGYLYTFLKTGAGGKYMDGLQKTLYNTDSAIRRTDGFDYSQTPIKNYYLFPINETGSYNSGGGQNLFDLDGHNHWLSMPYYYYMTGNEEIAEAINDYSEEWVKRGVVKSSAIVSPRAYSRFFKTVALAYEFNKDDRLRIILEDMTNNLLDSRDNPPNLKPFGRNLDRGYFWSSSGNPLEPAVNAFFNGAIHIEDMWQVLRVFKRYDKTYPRIEELEDYLFGSSQFVYNELFFVKPDGTDFGYHYKYVLHSANEWQDGTVYTGSYMRKDDTSRGMLIAYSNTGDPKYLERGKKLLAYGGGLASASPFPANDLIYTDLHGINGLWSYVNNVSAINNGNNKYTLTWTVPQGATAYKIKFSDKPIVDWLGFNQVTRTYQYDPVNYTAFFAATNIDDESAPLQSGSVQSYTIDIAQAINSYNAARNLSPGNPSYVVYDPSKTYYFSVKYLSSIQSPSSCGDGTCNGAETCSSCSQDCGTCSNKGDLTADNQVNIQDIQACVNHILGAQDWGAAADVNSDGAVNVLDVQAIVNIVLGG